MPDSWLYPALGAAAVIGILTFGIPLFLAEYFPWRSIYNQRHGKPTVKTESYKGRTAMITGANGAYGSRAAKIFAHRDIDTLILVDVADSGRVKKEIEDELTAKNKPVPKILIWKVDMMTFAGCKELADKAKRELKDGYLDHVLMTVGILSFNRRESPEGWETSIQVNYLSNALAALLLLPLLKSSPSNPNAPVLTFVTSFGIYPASFTMGVPKTGSYLKKLSNNRDGLEQGHQYGRSKALLLYFARELADRVSAVYTGKNKVTINSADPGSAWTPLTAPNQGMLIPRLIMNFGARDAKYGAAALVNGVSASWEEGHGKIMQDFDTATFPPFMLRKSGQVAQQRAWDETRAEFEAKVPEVKAIYELLERK
ncbi:hypothetical protein QBC35DRAFT_467174 [Podospora australis]|uniref:Uncharacterized protein n=1 Tax=Podospora australis TaxID=1536484 RepID=A0AAN7AF55_9PEZI|nr:hypothetical protein QBC35DRAFT_467174 [Podospora australis]